jgi:hypothetical protein
MLFKESRCSSKINRKPDRAFDVIGDVLRPVSVRSVTESRTSISSGETIRQQDAIARVLRSERSIKAVITVMQSPHAGDDMDGCGE